jgi:hypothetical protein
MTWADGHQVRADALLICPTCGGPLFVAEPVLTAAPPREVAEEYVASVPEKEHELVSDAEPEGL